MRLVFLWSGLLCLSLLALFPGEGPGKNFFLTCAQFKTLNKNTQEAKLI